MPASGAGSGAEEKARRAAAREADLEAQLARARKTRASWEAGAAGEKAVAAELERLTVDGWRVLHDVHWPGRPQANLDHIAVGPGGVVLVDAKNWSGSITVKDGVLRQNGYRRENVPQAAGSAAAAVTALLAPGHRSLLTSVVCFVQQPLSPVVVPPGVLVVGLHELSASLRSLPSVLGREAVEALHQHLARELTGPRSPRQETTRALDTAAPPSVREPSAATRRAAQRRVASWRPARPQPAPPCPAPAAARLRSSGPSEQAGVGITVLKALAVAMVLLLILGAVGSLNG